MRKRYLILRFVPNCFDDPYSYALPLQETLKVTMRSFLSGEIQMVGCNILHSYTGTRRDD